MKWVVFGVFLAVLILFSTSSFSVDESDGYVGIPETCTGEVPHGSCFADKPAYCDNGQIVLNCSFCGCDAGFECNGTACIKMPLQCGNTLNGQCSPEKPFYCYNGVLRPHCSLCGCNEGYECKNDTCLKSVLKCSDGTVNGTCSAKKPLYCHNGYLMERCGTCGCETGACANDGGCYENHPPYIRPIGNKEVKEGEVLEFYVNGSDPDGDSLSFYASRLPPGAYFEKTARKFHWNPAYNQKGNYWMDFFVLDDGEPVMSGHEEIMITVGEVNRPPAIDPIGDRKVDENVLIEFFVRASDPDGDNVVYSAEPLPEGAAFDNITSKFSWLPTTGQQGNYKIRFTVSDGKINVYREIVITVGNVNRMPVALIANPIANQEFLVGTKILFSAVTSYDEDGDKLAYSWDFGNGEVLQTGSPTTERFYTTAGAYNVVLSVSDGKNYSTKTITVNIIEASVKDTDGDGVYDAADQCPNTEPFKAVSIYGCELPRYNKFENDLTTDFSKVDLLNATNITIGIPEVAKIEFRKNELTLVGKNLNKYIEIGEGSIIINTEISPDLNKSAVITFYNVTLDNPIVTKDAVFCKECRLISYENSTFVFSVQHFTTYALLSRISYSGYCGDGLCSIYETCDNCQEDCGKCKEGASYAGGPPKACEEMWVCSGWSECNELNLRTRECVDVNICGTFDKKPKEAMECREGQDYSSFLMFGVTVMILVIAYLAAENYKRRKADRKMDEFELEKFVKSYIYRGYAASEIKKILEAKSYDESEVDKILKHVQKEIF